MALAVPCRAVFVICKICLGTQVSPAKGENAPAAGAWLHRGPAEAVGEAETILKAQESGRDQDRSPGAPSRSRAASAPAELLGALSALAEHSELGARGRGKG